MRCVRHDDDFVMRCTHELRDASPEDRGFDVMCKPSERDIDLPRFLLHAHVCEAVELIRVPLSQYGQFLALEQNG